MQGRCFKYIFIFFVNTMISCCTKTTFNQLLKKLIQNDIIYAVYIRTLVGTPFWGGLFGGRILMSLLDVPSLLPYMQTRNE
jgi:hypothetical protein